MSDRCRWVVGGQTGGGRWRREVRQVLVGGGRSDRWWEVAKGCQTGAGGLWEVSQVLGGGGGRSDRCWWVLGGQTGGGRWQSRCRWVVTCWEGVMGCQADVGGCWEVRQVLGGGGGRSGRCW
jgi:hypothetical protein